jgi:hypothetical protein
LNGYIDVGDGVRVQQYFTAPELYSNNNNEPASIGVVCHEFGHALGLPDYYDVDYGASGGYASGLGNWDIMDSGCWNNEGKTPSQNNAYSKYLLGWINLRELDKSGEIELVDIRSSNDAFIMNSANETEFFILENRQKKGFDKFIPHHGLLVYHVDRSNPGWTNNTINVDPDKQGFKLLDSKSFGKDCPFPGEAGVSYLTDISSPSNLMSNTMEYSHKSLFNIREEEELIRFTYFHDNRSYHKLEFSISSVGEDINDAQINLIRHDNSSAPIASKSSNSTGLVLFDKVSTGSYKLAIFKEGYFPYEKDISVYESKTIYAELEKMYSLRVHIENRGLGLEDVVVSLHPAQDNLSVSEPLTTNSNGDVVFENIEFGDYSVSAEKYHFETCNEFINFSSDYTLIIDLKAFDIKDALDTKLKIYPNPTHGEVNLELELSDEAIVMLIDMRGYVVFNEIFHGGILHTIDFGNQATGLYNFVIIDRGMKISNRLIIN